MALAPYAGSKFTGNERNYVGDGINRDGPHPTTIPPISYISKTELKANKSIELLRIF